MHCLVFTDTDLYSLTKGKSYLILSYLCTITYLQNKMAPFYVFTSTSTLIGVLDNIHSVDINVEER